MKIENENNSFFSCSGSSPTDFVDFFEPRERVVFYKITSSGEKVELYHHSVKDFTKDKYLRILASFEKNGAEIHYEFRNFEDCFKQKNKGLPLRE